MAMGEPFAKPEADRPRVDLGPFLSRRRRSTTIVTRSARIKRRRNLGSFHRLSQAARSFPIDFAPAIRAMSAQHCCNCADTAITVMRISRRRFGQRENSGHRANALVHFCRILDNPFMKRKKSVATTHIIPRHRTIATRKKPDLQST